MTSGPGDPRPPLLTAMADHWRAFWFTSEPAYVLGLIRIGFGALVIAWTLVSFSDLYDLFGERGVVPEPPPFGYRWTLFTPWPSDQALLIGWVVLLVAAIGVTVGWHSRVSAVIVFVLLLSFGRRDVAVFNAGDGVITFVSLVLVPSSCGAALSLDQRRREGSFWTAQYRSRWPLRLIQVQLSLMYLVSVQAKLAGKTWVDGSAVSYAWRSDLDRAVLPVPQFIWDDVYVVNVATWGALLIELSIAILVWSQRWRLYVLGAGVVLHTMIMVTMSVGFFSFAMFVMYLAFVPWETVQRMPSLVTNAWSRVRGVEPSRIPAPDGRTSGPP